MDLRNIPPEKTRNIMLVTLIITGMLLALLIVYLIITEKGNGQARKDEIVTPAPTPTPISLLLTTPVPETTPELYAVTPALTAAPTEAPTAAVLPVATTAPTSIPVCVKPEVIVSDNVPMFARATVTQTADEMASDESNWSENALNAKVYAQAFVYPAYTSVLFTLSEDDKTVKQIPYVYNENGTKLKATDVFCESYLAIIKEKLQTEVLTVDELFKGTSFVTYNECYKASDYDSFYFHDDELTFVFDENSLIDKPHRAFSYTVKLNGAKPFMFVDTNGNRQGYTIRTDLDRTKKMVALTFDDGPYEPVERALLNIFSQYDARATFFVCGERIDKYETCKKSVIALAEAGNEIGSHLYTHAVFFSEDTNPEDFWKNINKNSRLIADTVGFAPTLCRMPGGYDYYDFVSKCPMPLINWKLDTRDWDKGKTVNDQTYAYYSKVAQVYNTVMAADAEDQLDGSIVLMHSLYMSSAHAVNKFMAELSAKDYIFVTVSELAYYKGCGLEAGKVTYGFDLKTNVNKDYSKKDSKEQK